MPEHQGEGRDMGVELHASRITMALPTVWLALLVLPVTDAWGESGTARWSLGTAATIAFAVVYTWTFELARRARAQRRLDLDVWVRWRSVLALLACELLMLYGLGQRADGATVFTCVVLAMILPGLQPAFAVPALAGGVLAASFAISGWMPNYLMFLVAIAAGFVMWGIKQILAVNFSLIEMRDAQRELAREQERTRFSRDLHDILGHSLTVVAVKAELAHRVLDVDPERAASEIREIESLSRDALADIRRALNGSHEPSLPAELARARQALVTARIDAHVPFAVDEVTGPAREMFAWAVREGVTNVLRHSRASTCRIEVSPRRLVISDDGVGDPSEGDGRGTGIRGLADRAMGLGASVVTRKLEPQGFELVVEMEA